MKPLFFFIRIISTHKKSLLLSIALSVLFVSSALALLSLSGWFISAAAYAGLSASLAIAFNYFIPAATIRSLAFIRILSRYAERVINHDYTFRILATLRVWFYKKLLPLSPARLLIHRSGDLLNRIIHDIDTLDQLYLNMFSPFLVALFITVGVPVFIGFFSPPLAWLMLCIFLFTLFSIPWFTYQKGKIIGKQQQDGTASLRMAVVDALQGYLDLLLFVKQKNRADAVMISHQQLMLAQKKLANLKSIAMGFMTALSGISLFLLLVRGVPLVEKNSLGGAQLAMIILLVIAAFDQLTAFPLACLVIGKTQRAAKRILDITLEKPAVIFPTDSKTMLDYHLNIDRVSYTYPDCHHLALNNLSLNIPSGMKLGLKGPSGAGKTTLLHLLARIYDPTSGDIVISGLPLQTLSESNLRGAISLVTQHVHIFNDSIRDNLTLGNPLLTDTDCEMVLEKMDLLKTVSSLPMGIHTLMGEFGKNFSGGQIRRISIARALLANTPIILLDEPTTGLEDDLIQAVWKNCEDDFKKKTVIVATHDDVLLSRMDSVVAVY